MCRVRVTKVSRPGSATLPGVAPPGRARCLLKAPGTAPTAVRLSLTFSLTSLSPTDSVGQAVVRDSLAKARGGAAVAIGGERSVGRAAPCARCRPAPCDRRVPVAQPPQRGEVLPVVRIGDDRAGSFRPARLRRLNQERQPGEP